MGVSMFNSEYMSPAQIEQMKKDSIDPNPPVCEDCGCECLYEEVVEVKGGFCCLKCNEVVG